MKKAVIATLLSGAIAAPAFAASESNLADADKVFNMDNAQTMELAALSSEEMKSTEGELVPFLSLGLALGTNFTARSVGGYFATRAATIFGAYSLGDSTFW
ncbi:hypothetical protein [Halomonas llamarensis]|uniref:Uncharacterized protein n=1 Tax=Halomonas llamarensis TaxID=2945104 RepID=A0ABT0ST31_9GAMM|nr:hypothetical protein [Halomonas llamarensis]MCL7930881.1 hypothetical protein [Halomonas llamarensis]